MKDGIRDAPYFTTLFLSYCVLNLNMTSPLLTRPHVSFFQTNKTLNKGSDVHLAALESDERAGSRKRLASHDNS